MKYILCFTMLAFTLCNKSSTPQKETQSKDLKIEIINNEIISRSNFSRENELNVVRFKNFIYDSLPVNKINVKITNVGKKKYVFFICKEISEENLLFKIYKGNIELAPTDMNFLVQYTMKDFYVRKKQLEDDTDSLKIELNNRYLKEKISNEKIVFQREMNYVIIHPGETRYFSYYKTLPIYKDNMFSYYIYRFDKDQNYYFQISLNNDKEITKKNLTVNQLKEIEENGYTVFDGKIQSNKVPIKFVSF